MSLESIDLFNGLSEEELAILYRYSSVRDYKKNVTVINEGDHADGLYVIEEGRVKVYCADKSGKEYVLNVLEPGDYFGELALVDDDPRSASVRSIEPCKVRIVRKKEFDLVLEDYPGIGKALIQNLVRRIRELTNDVKALALQDVYGRVANVLNSLATEIDGKLKINEKLTQQDIADRVGASREMVARILKDLTLGEYVELEGRKIVLLRKLPESY